MYTVEKRQNEFLIRAPRMHNEERIVSLRNGDSATGRIMKPEPHSTPYTETNSKQTKYLSIRLETTRLLEEYIRGKLLDISLGNDFFGSDTKNTGNKSKNEQVEIAQKKKKKKSAAQHRKQSTKWKPTEWEKVFTNHTSDKQLISKICKELILNGKKPK